MNVLMFLSGITMMTFAMAAVVFWRVYRSSRDRFFLYFAAAFALLSLEDVVIVTRCHPFETIRSPISDNQSWIYLIRLFAFAMIACAVIVKNRRRS